MILFLLLAYRRTKNNTNLLLSRHLNACLLCNAGKHKSTCRCGVFEDFWQSKALVPCIRLYESVSIGRIETLSCHRTNGCMGQSLNGQLSYLIQKGSHVENIVANQDPDILLVVVLFYLNCGVFFNHLCWLVACRKPCPRSKSYSGTERTDCWPVLSRIKVPNDVVLFYRIELHTDNRASSAHWY